MMPSKPLMLWQISPNLAGHLQLKSILLAIKVETLVSYQTLWKSPRCLNDAGIAPQLRIDPTRFGQWVWQLP